MNIFWNQEGNDKINGQDVIGLRRIDQAIEKEWVAGITTISQRAKYISMLVWGLVEAYKVMPDKDEQKQFDEKLLDLIFSRIEFIVLAASRWVAKQNESDDDFGLLGADVHKKEVDLLFEVGSVQVPEGKVVGLIGTYYVTSSMFGLVFHDSDSALPISISSRGKLLWEAIETKVATSQIKEIILNGGAISTKDLDAHGKYFAANELKSCIEERKILEDAFTLPPDQSEGYKRLYSNLNDTLSILKEFGTGTTDAEQIILNNFRSVQSDDKAHGSRAKVSWAEYEARRRTHYVLELLLYRVSKTLNDHGPMSTGAIIGFWADRREEIEKDNELFNFAEDPFSCTMDTYIKGVMASHAEIDKYLHFSNFENDTAAVMSGLSLLIDTYLTFSNLVLNKTIRNRSSILEAVFALIDKSKTITVTEFLNALIFQAVVYPHVSNTLRKMANGAKCSLRLYIDGNQIYPTGINPYPGRSGTRLYNVINLFVDIGCIDRDDEALKVLVV